uniref:Uncharacterized protein n=1 Tax=Anguilla anguilla TaxID=7936 RepID=A0A0E9WVL6_ANGAN
MKFIRDSSSFNSACRLLWIIKLLYKNEYDYKRRLILMFIKLAKCLSGQTESLVE